MCFDRDARPPVPTVSGGSFDSERAVLAAADGTPFRAYAARAGVSDNPGVVVMPDVRGLFTFYEELADRFAERGFDAIAIDYFGRTAGLDDREDDFDFWPHVEQTTEAGVNADVAAAVAVLRDGNPDRPIFTIGFCFGGSGSWLQAAAGHRLTGAIGFYGRPTTARPGFRAPAEVVDEMEGAVLGLFGGADQSISPDDVAAFDVALSAAGVDHELHSYDGAPHSFFDRKAEEFADESADAWERVLGFIASHTSVERA